MVGPLGWRGSHQQNSLLCLPTSQSASPDGAFLVSLGRSQDSERSSSYYDRSTSRTTRGGSRPHLERSSERQFVRRPCLFRTSGIL